jgi:hypothetical protein
MEAITVSGKWEKAMKRAVRDNRKATLLSDGRFRVASKSHKGTVHYVSLDDHGHIAHCSDCPWWARYGRTNPCGHAGAVAIALSALKGFTLEAPAGTGASQEDDYSAPESGATKSQIFRMAA